MKTLTVIIGILLAAAVVALIAAAFWAWPVMLVAGAYGLGWSYSHAYPLALLLTLIIGACNGR